jgi:hypothetical protein
LESQTVQNLSALLLQEFDEGPTQGRRAAVLVDGEVKATCEVKAFNPKGFQGAAAFIFGNGNGG